MRENPKQFPNSNAPNSKLISLRHWDLGFGVCLEFSASDLGFIIILATVMYYNKNFLICLSKSINIFFLFVPPE